MFSLAVALLIAHLLDSRGVPRGYVLAAFVASVIVAAGDLREHVGQTCVVSVDDLGRHVETCMAQYAVKTEALVALVASVAFAALVLVFEILDRLAAAATGGWGV